MYLDGFIYVFINRPCASFRNLESSDGPKQQPPTPPLSPSASQSITQQLFLSSERLAANCSDPFVLCSVGFDRSGGWSVGWMDELLEWNDRSGGWLDELLRSGRWIARMVWSLRQMHGWMTWTLVACVDWNNWILYLGHVVPPPGRWFEAKTRGWLAYTTTMSNIVLYM